MNTSAFRTNQTADDRRDGVLSALQGLFRDRGRMQVGDESYTCEELCAELLDSADIAERELAPIDLAAAICAERDYELEPKLPWADLRLYIAAFLGDVSATPSPG